jgi:nitrile hydratase subunit beta
MYIGVVDGVHDMGGMHGFGRAHAPGDEVAYHEPWEPRAQVLALLSMPRGASMRNYIEALDPADYLASSYYVRWLAAAEQMLVQQGVLTADDLQHWHDHFATDPEAAMPRRDDPALAARVAAWMSGGSPLAAPVAPTFRPGDAVVVKRMHSKPICRCPRYVRGVRGTVEAVCGDDEAPGATGGHGAVAAVYTVRFESHDVWGPTDEPPFSLHVDLWEPYLEAAR